MDIGQKIKNLRQERNYSQKRLAELAGIAPSYLCDIEKGRYDGSVRALAKIAEALQVELKELL